MSQVTTLVSVLCPCPQNINLCQYQLSQMTFTESPIYMQDGLNLYGCWLERVFDCTLVGKKAVRNAMSFLSIISNSSYYCSNVWHHVRCSTYYVTFTVHHEVAVTIAYLQRNSKVRRPVKFTENDKTVAVSAFKDKVALLLWEGNKLQNQLNRYCLIIQNF